MAHFGMRGLLPSVRSVIIGQGIHREVPISTNAVTLGIVACIFWHAGELCVIFFLKFPFISISETQHNKRKKCFKTFVQSSFTLFCRSQKQSVVFPINANHAAISRLINSF